MCLCVLCRFRSKSDNMHRQLTLASALFEEETIRNSDCMQPLLVPNSPPSIPIGRDFRKLNDYNGHRDKTTTELCILLPISLGYSVLVVMCIMALFRVRFNLGGF